MSDNIIDAEQEFELAALRSEIEKLRIELTKYKILLNEVDDEANPNVITETEAICHEQIRKLKESSGVRQLSTDEVKKLDILHKNLKLARGEGSRVGNKSKAGKMTAEQLSDIAKGS